MSLPPFQTLLDRHGRQVLGFLVASLGPQEAEDCFQETFLAALRAYPRLEHDGNLRAWLFTIAHHKAIDAHRARARRPLPVEEPPEVPVDPPEPPRPELWAAVRGLPPKQRDAVLHRFLSGLSHAEIGRVMGISEEAARQNTHQGLLKLRGAWTP